MADQFEVLRAEFGSEEASFLIQLRASLHWDPQAFIRLDRAMRAACESTSGDDHLERWMAEGFHYTPTFVQDWTTHPHFPRPLPDSYYEACQQRLDDLAYWFFMGESPYIEPHPWPDLHP